MSSNEPNTIDSDDNATLIELGTADIEALRDDSELPDAEPSINTKKRKARSIICTDLWEESRDPHGNEPARNAHKQRIFYCKKCTFKQTAYNRIREHLLTHGIRIAAQPSEKKVVVEGSIEGLFGKQKAREEGRNIEQEKYLKAAVNKKAYNEALIQLIARRGLPLSVPDWAELYTLIHSINYMAVDIVMQSRSLVPQQLDDSFHLHQSAIMKRLQASLSLIHFSIDLWSAPNHKSLQAIVAHFVDADTRKVQKALLSLRELSGTHSGEAQAEIFISVVEQYGIKNRIGWFTLDNVYSNDTMLRAIARSIPQLDPTQHRLRCNGHVINLAVQAFLFSKDKEASDEAIRQIALLSKNETKGNLERQVSAAEWRKLGALGMLHNLVIYIRSSDQLYQSFLHQAGRMIPRDNKTRWNSWYLMIHVALSLRGEVNNFIDERMKAEPSLLLDYLLPSHWQELQELHDFLEPFYEVTKDTEWDTSTLDQVLSSMDFLLTHYNEAKQQYKGNGVMMERLLTSWYKFDDYYTLTDNAPVYAAATLLHPSLRQRYLTTQWAHQSNYINPAINAARKLWTDYKTASSIGPKPQEELSALQRWKRRVYLQDEAEEGDEFERFIKVRTLQIPFSAA